MAAPSEMGGTGTTGHAPIMEEEEDDEDVDEAGVEAKVRKGGREFPVNYYMIKIINKTTISQDIYFSLPGFLQACNTHVKLNTPIFQSF